MHQIQLLKKYGLSVRGSRGQHLLIDENIQRKIVSLVDPKNKETIVEIGPGLGAITELLLKSGTKVVAIEYDPRFVEILQGELGNDFKNLTLVKGDILKIDLKKYAPAKSKLKVVGNIPYYIASPILLHLIDCRPAIDLAYLTVQKEIADRLFAQPGTKLYGRLTLLVRFYSDIRRAFEISRNCFSPKPNVDSTVIELSFGKSIPKSIDGKLVFDLIKFGFGARRKNLLNALTDGLGSPDRTHRLSKDEIRSVLMESGIHETARAEELMLKDFIRLADLFSRR